MYQYLTHTQQYNTTRKAKAEKNNNSTNQRQTPQ